MHVSTCFSAGATIAADVIMVSVLALVGSVSKSEKHFKAALGERGTSGELLINALKSILVGWPLLGWVTTLPGFLFG